MYVRSKGDKRWVELATLPAFGKESELELLLAESPELLPGHPTNLALVRQLYVPMVNGYVDLCGVAADGSVYLVECKLAGNSDMRRTIVGQLLAYAAGLTGITREDFLAQFDKAGSLQEVAASDPATYFERLPDGERDPEYDRQRMLDRLADNLEAGRFRLVFAVDQLTDELRLTVNYLEQQMTTVSVSALEVAFAQFGDVELVRPALHGAGIGGAEARSTMPPATTPSDFDAAQAKLPEHVHVAFRYIRDASVAAGAEIWGARRTQPTLYGNYDVDGRTAVAWMMSANPSRPGFGIMWRWLHGPLSSDELQQLYEEVKDIPGAEIWRGVQQKWNYVNLLTAEQTFRDPQVAVQLMDALHRALGRRGADRTQRGAGET